jgi:uncharacterized protein YvpB
MKITQKSINYLFTGIIIVVFVLLIGIRLFPQLINSQNQKPNVIKSAETIDVSNSVSQTMTAIVASTKAALPPTSTPSPELTKLPPTKTPLILPDSFYIKGIIGHGQYFALGCEASAAVDLAGYYDILIYQYNFQHELPLSDNPDLGFVGDAKGPWGQVPPYAYGVYAQPVADLLQKYGLDVEAGKGYTLEDMKVKLAQSKPVIVWVIGNMEGGVPAEYTDSKGKKTVVAAYEHVVILTGYNASSVRYLNNGRFYEVPNEVFMNSWGVLENMAVALK